MVETINQKSHYFILFPIIFTKDKLHMFGIETKIQENKKFLSLVSNQKVIHHRVE
jgi:hypothetical protein